MNCKCGVSRVCVVIHLCADCQLELVSLCQIVVKRFSAVLTRKDGSRCKQGNENMYEAMFMKGVLQIFELLAEAFPDFRDESFMTEVIQVTSSCLVHPVSNVVV